jgi:regulator of cell morphogenesis and NO signaling
MLIQRNMEKKSNQENLDSTEQKYSASDRMRDIVSRDYNILPALSRFDISPGFGDAPVSKVCADSNVDCGTFLAVANYISGHGISSPATISLPSLIRYLKSAHSYFLDYLLPVLRRRLVDVVSDISNNDLTLMIMRFYDEYVEQVRTHMEFEDRNVFSYVEQLLNGELSDQFTIAHFKEHHTPIAEKLHDLKEIFISHYKAPGNSAERVNTVLFNIITCEHDLLTHCQVEEALFVPAVARLERELTRKIKTRPAKQRETTTTDTVNPAMLSDREKDIVCCVARGLSNKEIATQLCLSVHTVTTHRRNISSKLNIHSAAGLAIYAIIHKLVDLSEVKAQ